MNQYTITGNEESGYILEYNQGEQTINKAGDYLKGLSHDIQNNIKEVRLPESARIISESCFQGFSNLEIIKGLERVRVIQDKAFQDCQCLRDIKFGEQLEVIGESAFFACCELKKIYIPDSVKCIKGNAFGSCKQLEEVRLPQNLYVIEQATFSNCINLNKIKFPDTLRIIKARAFYECSKLKSFVLPENLTEIETEAFCNCAVEDLVIPYNVTRLKHVFNQCSDLKRVDFLNEFIVLNGTFIGCVSLENISTNYFYNCSFNTFEGCPKISKIRVSEDTLAQIRFPTVPSFSSRPAYPDTIYPISNSPSFPIKKYIKTDKGRELQYEIKEKEFILYGYDFGPNDSCMIHYVANFIHEPTHEHFTWINEKEHKILLAIAYCNYDNRFKNYVKNHITDILCYIGETEDFELLSTLIDNKFISNRLIDKCIDFIRDEEYHEMFIMLTQYKEEQGGYSRKTNQKRFDL